MKSKSDERVMRLALRLAARGRGRTSPNPMVGAVLVLRGRIIGRGWHHAAGRLHAEIEALRDAERRGHRTRGATMYVTLEPCCSHGRTPPCTEAILKAGIRRVVAAATDPNPRHAGRGFRLLKKGGVTVSTGVLSNEASALNAAFNHWIVHRTPFVTVKAAMTLDGKIATADGESKWITGPKARTESMRLRAGADSILVGVNTVLADDPSLTLREGKGQKAKSKRPGLRRVILDTHARTPLDAKVVTDEFAALTTIVVGKSAPKRRVAALGRRVSVIVASERNQRVDLRWLMRRLGAEEVTSLLVEGGGEVNASFLFGGHAHRVAFFYAPKILGGREALKAVAGEGAKSRAGILSLQEVRWRRLGPDLLLTARLASRDRLEMAR
jgi:diaminohydroxyphosphoribosylaminopyrimidine deaminase/5-amino-6-(5-phosphoribosylamino)uracil reductase